MNYKSIYIIIYICQNSRRLPHTGPPVQAQNMPALGLLLRLNASKCLE